MLAGDLMLLGDKRVHHQAQTIYYKVTVNKESILPIGRSSFIFDPLRMSKCLNQSPPPHSSSHRDRLGHLMSISMSSICSVRRAKKPGPSVLGTPHESLAVTLG